MKISAQELSIMDFDFFFKDGDKIIHEASNGEIDKYLELDSDDQDELFDYFDNLKETSDYDITDKAVIYPITDSFTDMAKKGIYSYDAGELVSTPKTPLSYKNLPDNIKKILPDYLI